MTYQDLMEAIAARIAKLWPERMLYRDFCPADHKRPSGFLYVTSASEDIWADPVSEFLSCVAASEAYRFLGRRGLVYREDAYPAVGEALHRGEIGYHLREGGHFLSRYDWQRFLAFMAVRL